MEDFLFSKKLYFSLGSNPKGMKVEDCNILGRKILGVICLTLSKSVTLNIAKEKMIVEMIIVEMIQALAYMCEKPYANNKVYLMKKLFNLKMSEGSSVG